jgi:hypothetical protein
MVILAILLDYVHLWRYIHDLTVYGEYIRSHSRVVVMLCYVMLWSMLNSHRVHHLFKLIVLILISLNHHAIKGNSFYICSLLSDYLIVLCVCYIVMRNIRDHC